MFVLNVLVRFCYHPPNAFVLGDVRFSPSARFGEIAGAGDRCITGEHETDV